MSDLIKREDAIEVIKGNSFAPGVDYMEINGYGAIEDIRALPSADRPQGEWKSVKASIYPYGYDVECSVCGFRMGSSFGYKYCPNCGARMKGAEDD